MAEPTATCHLSHPSKGPAAPESWPPVRDPGACRQASQSGWAVSQVIKSPTPQCVPLLSKKQPGGACTAAQTAPGAASPPTAYTRPTQLSPASCSESDGRPPPVSNALVLVPLLSLWAAPGSTSASVRTARDALLLKDDEGSLLRPLLTPSGGARGALSTGAPTALCRLLPRAPCSASLHRSPLPKASPRL